MNDFISKPFIPEVLYAALLKWMEPQSERLSIDPSLSVGIPRIDQEHHDLIRQFDSLMNNPDVYPGTEHFSEVLGQLGAQFKGKRSTPPYWQRRYPGVSFLSGNNSSIRL